MSEGAGTCRAPSRLQDSFTSPASGLGSMGRLAGLVLAYKTRSPARQAGWGPWVGWPGSFSLTRLVHRPGKRAGVHGSVGRAPSRLQDSFTSQASGLGSMGRLAGLLLAYKTRSPARQAGWGRRELRLAHRFDDRPGLRHDDLGFRVSLVLADK